MKFLNKCSWKFVPLCRNHKYFSNLRLCQNCGWVQITTVFCRIFLASHVWDKEKGKNNLEISHLHLFDNQVCRLKKLEKNANSCACSAAHKSERLHAAFRIRRQLSFSHCNASESSHFEPQISEVSRSYEEIVNCMTVISTHWPATILQDVCSS